MIGVQCSAALYVPVICACVCGGILFIIQAYTEDMNFICRVLLVVRY